MYYANIQGSTLYVYDAEDGSPHFTVSVSDALTSFNVNGNIMSVCYNDGRVEIYNLEKRSRIR